MPIIVRGIPSPNSTAPLCVTLIADTIGPPAEKKLGLSSFCLMLYSRALEGGLFTYDST